MSGPKVVDIEAVTLRQKRESLMQLHKLQAALSEWNRWQSQLSSQSQASSLLKRLDELRMAGQWQELREQSASLSSFYEVEAQRLQRQHAEQKAADLSRLNRLGQSVAQMTALLQRQPASPERDGWIGRLASSNANTQEKALHGALNFIEQAHGDANTQRLRDFTAAFADPSIGSSTFVLSQSMAHPQEQRLEKCWKLLGEFSSLEDSTGIETLIERARKIAAASGDQQVMLLDSLAIEISSHLQNQRATQALRKELELALAELEELCLPEVTSWKERIHSALEQRAKLETLQLLLQEVRTWTESAFAHEARLEQRAAVLRALAGSGYEVREGMVAAWVESGRIIVHKPNESLYGIELSAPKVGTSIQVRVAALTDAPRNPQRDREVEVAWCGEFEAAQRKLREAGFTATLTQAYPPGAIPMKIAVVTPSTQDEYDKRGVRGSS